jgi:hypothetical protein
MEARQGPGWGVGHRHPQTNEALPFSFFLCLTRFFPPRFFAAGARCWLRSAGSDLLRLRVITKSRNREGSALRLVLTRRFLIIASIYRMDYREGWAQRMCSRKFNGQQVEGSCELPNWPTDRQWGQTTEKQNPVHWGLSTYLCACLQVGVIMLSGSKLQLLLNCLWDGLSRLLPLRCVILQLSVALKYPAIDCGSCTQ